MATGPLMEYHGSRCQCLVCRADDPLANLPGVGLEVARDDSGSFNQSNMTKIYRSTDVSHCI